MTTDATVEEATKLSLKYSLMIAHEINDSKVVDKMSLETMTHGIMYAILISSQFKFVKAGVCLEEFIQHMIEPIHIAIAGIKKQGGFEPVNDCAKHEH